MGWDSNACPYIERPLGLLARKVTAFGLHGRIQWDLPTAYMGGPIPLMMWLSALFLWVKVRSGESASRPDLQHSSRHTRCQVFQELLGSCDTVGQATTAVHW